MFFSILDAKCRAFSSKLALLSRVAGKFSQLQCFISQSNFTFRAKECRSEKVNYQWFFVAYLVSWKNVGHHKESNLTYLFISCRHFTYVNDLVIHNCQIDKKGKNLCYVARERIKDNGAKRCSASNIIKHSTWYWPQNPSKFCFSSAKVLREFRKTFYLDSWNYWRKNKYRKDKFYILAILSVV